MTYMKVFKELNPKSSHHKGKTFYLCEMMVFPKLMW